MHNFTWNWFRIKNLLIDCLLIHIVESTYLNIHTCKFESSQKDECRIQSAHFSKGYRKPRTFNCYFQIFPKPQFFALQKVSITITHDLIYLRCTSPLAPTTYFRKFQARYGSVMFNHSALVLPEPVLSRFDRFLLNQRKIPLTTETACL